MNVGENIVFVSIVKKNTIPIESPEKFKALEFMDQVRCANCVKLLFKICSRCNNQLVNSDDDKWKECSNCHQFKIPEESNDILCNECSGFKLSSNKYS